MATDRIQTGIRFPETLLRKITYIARNTRSTIVPAQLGDDGSVPPVSK